MQIFSLFSSFFSLNLSLLFSCRPCIATDKAQCYSVLGGILFPAVFRRMTPARWALCRKPRDKSIQRSRSLEQNEQ